MRYKITDLAKKSSITLAVMTLLSGCASERLFDLRGIASMNGESLTGWQQSYERGKKFLNQGRYGLALTAFEQELSANGPTIPVYNALGITYSELGRAEIGLRYFELALRIDPEHAGTLNNIGNAARRRGEVELASRYLQRAKLYAMNDARARIERNLASLNVNILQDVARPSTEESNDQLVQYDRSQRQQTVIVDHINEGHIRLYTMGLPIIPKPRPSLGEHIICRIGIFNCGIRGNVPYQFSISTII